jgi:hypothetical protein
MLVEKLWQTASQECEGDLPRLKNATYSRQRSRWQGGEAARNPLKSLMEHELVGAPPSGTKVERHCAIVPVGTSSVVESNFLSPGYILFPPCNNILAARECSVQRLRQE